MIYPAIFRLTKLYKKTDFNNISIHPIISHTKLPFDPTYHPPTNIDPAIPNGGWRWIPRKDGRFSGSLLTYRRVPPWVPTIYILFFFRQSHIIRGILRCSRSSPWQSVLGRSRKVASWNSKGCRVSGLWWSSLWWWRWWWWWLFFLLLLLLLLCFFFKKINCYYLYLLYIMIISLVLLVYLRNYHY